MPRKNAQEFIKDQTDVNYGFGGTKESFIRTDVLEELGVKEFYPETEEDKSAKQHEIYILPANEDDSPRYALELFIHYGVGPNSADVLCPKMMKLVFEKFGIEVPKEFKDGRCPICEEVDRLQEQANTMRENKEDNYDFWKNEIQPLYSFFGKASEKRPRRYLMWVKPLSDVETDTKYFYRVPVGVYEKGVMAKTKTRQGAIIDLADPDDGYVFYFEKEGEGLATKYFNFGVDKTNEAYEESWLNVPRYTDILVFHTYDEIKSIFEGGVTAENENTDLEEKLEQRTSRRRRTQVEMNDDVADVVETEPQTSNDESSEEETVSEDAVEAIRERVNRRRNCG